MKDPKATRICIDTPETAGLPEQGWFGGEGAAGTINRDGVDAGMDRAINWWRVTFPEEAARFERQMVAKRGDAAGQVVMTRNRTMRLHCDIPSRLFYRVGEEIGCRDWILDEDVRERFYKRFRIGLMDPKNPYTQR